MTTVNLPSALIVRVEAEARERHCNPSEFVAYALKDWFVGEDYLNTSRPIPRTEPRVNLDGVFPSADPLPTDRPQAKLFVMPKPH